ncbi:hypothetical protein SDC9_178181 [bioreactor metagenome]|uniref:Uncharacterized protein n=1 Tax=bioreactor metagenome TaxID=1076179 RepID=A0A645GWH9_9ZZZZ
MQIWVARIERIGHPVAHKMGHSRQTLGQLLGGVNGGGLCGKELFEQCFQGRPGRRVYAQLLASRQVSAVEDQFALAINVKSKFAVIGEDQVMQGRQVAAHLLRALDLVQVGINIFGLHIPQRHVAFFYDEIRGAALDVLGIRRSLNTAFQALHKELKRGAVGIFSGIAAMISIVDVLDVSFKK